jgi:hypothetical protein
MITELTNLITEANATYEVFYEESKMFNVSADELTASGGKYCHIEEFIQGSINDRTYHGMDDTASAQVYFFKIINKETTNESTAAEREDIRESIKQEVIYPLVALIKSNRLNQNIKNFKYTYPISKYDCEETGVMLEFDFKTAVCEIGS